MIKEEFNINKTSLSMLGLTFKENCPDLRNSKVIEMLEILNGFIPNIKVYDPLVDYKIAQKDFNIQLTSWDKLEPADILVAAVSHKKFIEMGINTLLKKLKPGGIFVDIKSAYPSKNIVAAGFKIWRL